jgi:hypothetical protein
MAGQFTPVEQTAAGKLFPTPPTAGFTNSVGEAVVPLVLGYNFSDPGAVRGENQRPLRFNICDPLSNTFVALANVPKSLASPNTLYDTLVKGLVYRKCSPPLYPDIPVLPVAPDHCDFKIVFKFAREALVPVKVLAHPEDVRQPTCGSN